MNRLTDLMRFYTLLERLKQRVAGPRTLANFVDYSEWPSRGVYLFFEQSEARSDSGDGLRVVRVGTHALGLESKSTLRQRLGQHRGRPSGGGNHRGSIFRLLVGQALLAEGHLGECRSWGVKSDITRASEALSIHREALSKAEAPVEHAVTQYLGAMPFLWINVDDQPGPNSKRGVIERNSIALLSNHGRAPLDPPSLGWLGNRSNRSLVRSSGLWNQRHVEETYDPGFLDLFEILIAPAEPVEPINAA
jgi:hypothetical protein